LATNKSGRENGRPGVQIMTVGRDVHMGGPQMRQPAKCGECV
jgi:hypothetical protein